MKLEKALSMKQKGKRLVGIWSHRRGPWGQPCGGGERG